jgi:hypothetical protein
MKNVPPKRAHSYGGGGLFQAYRARKGKVWQGAGGREEGSSAMQGRARQDKAGYEKDRVVG